MKLYAKVSSLPAEIADVVTPVAAYLKLRDIYPNTLLLESMDDKSENEMSFICFAPISEFVLDGDTINIIGAGECRKTITEVGQAERELHAFITSFEVEGEDKMLSHNGVFGYTGYGAASHFDSLRLQKKDGQPYAVPDMRYAAYRNILCFAHSNNKITLIENCATPDEQSAAESVRLVLLNPVTPRFSFAPSDDERSNVTDEEFMDYVTQGKKHCQRGDVFQIVPSRQFSRGFTGDEFNVYRALRQINPSPYMFYFDYGGYKIFGSSPETQILIRNGEAQINPIAGTFPRTGDDAKDRALAVRLREDPKESAEHVMLVDLARNDLSRLCTGVRVDVFKDIQWYSHVLHMVSQVSGRLNPGATAVGVMAATFPAGTLSGAPKYRAMQLIDQIENQPRGIYGGCIGIINFNGDLNQAILIRTFLSRGNRLYYQAGCGVVAKSREESELNEVNKKLGALTAAITAAKEF